MERRLAFQRDDCRPGQTPLEKTPAALTSDGSARIAAQRGVAEPWLGSGEGPTFNNKLGREAKEPS